VTLKADVVDLSASEDNDSRHARRGRDWTNLEIQIDSMSAAREQ
jgi:hypothetical protein